MVIEKEATAAIPPGASRAQTGIVLRVIDACADGLLVVALIGELGIVFANVLARVFFNTSFLWADEVARFVLSIIAFIGGAVAYRRRETLLCVCSSLGAPRGCSGCCSRSPMSWRS
jgi:hypothetical protein